MSERLPGAAKRRSLQAITLLVVFLLSVLIWRGYTPHVTNWFIGMSMLSAIISTEMALRGKAPGRAALWSTAVPLAISALWAALLPAVFGQNAQQLAVREINHQIGMIIKLYGQLGTSANELEQIKQLLEHGAKVLAVTYPALASISIFMTGGLGLLVYNRLSKRFNPAYSPLFHSFKVPEPLIWLLIMAGFSMLIDYQPVKVPALNLVIMMATLYFLQGMAVMLCVASRQAFGGVIKLFLAILLIFVPMLAIPPVTALGIFDMWGNFRTPKKKDLENL